VEVRVLVMEVAWHGDGRPLYSLSHLEGKTGAGVDDRMQRCHHQSRRK